MTIQSFIEKAIEGGWDCNDYKNMAPEFWASQARVEMLSDDPEKYLLDPLAWKAVGKVSGWPMHEGSGEDMCFGWLYKMHRMIDALAEGKTLEQYLETL